MSVLPRCGALILFAGLLMSASAAGAQTNPAPQSGSSWSDPPARGSAAPAAPGPAKPAEAKPPSSAEGAPPQTNDAQQSAETAGAQPTPAQRAEASLGVKAFGAHRTTQTHRAIARPRMVERPLVIARRHARTVERPSHRLARRYASNGKTRLAQRAYHSYAAASSGRRLSGWGGLIEDNPAARAARAREMGYLPAGARPIGGDAFGGANPFDFDRFGDLD